MNSLSFATTDNRPLLRDEVEAALNQVYDPCSVAAGHPLGLVDMGLVNAIAIDSDGSVDVTLRVTFAGCLMMPSLAGAAEDLIAAIPGVRSVAVGIDMNMTWTPTDMRPRSTPIPSPVLRGKSTLGPIGGSKKEETL